jgi:alpha-beta hydrolase superfamily lysophospholipase
MRQQIRPISRLPRRRFTRRPVVAVSLAATLTALSALASAPGAARASTLSALNCSAHTLPVAIADPGPADQTLWGQLCYRGPQEPGTVQVLVPGATYNHLYWNFPYGDGYYSYVDAATAAGYATFDVDPIGQGNSSHPPSAEVTLTAEAVALHDAITALRSGAVGGHPFSHVITVGHSIGSVDAWLEAATYQDADAMIITGALHALSPDISVLEDDLYPAALDPRFASSGLDAGYLTTEPGTRGSIFYDPRSTDQNVVTADEADKDTVTVPVLAGATSMLALPPDQQPSDQISVPVLVAVGADDNLFCTGVTVYNCDRAASVQAFESQYYSPAAHLTLVTIPGTGHDLALATTAPITDAVMIGWSLSVVAP